MAQVDPREALRRAIAQEHRLHQEIQKHELLADRWRRRAALAGRRGEQGLGQEALDREANERRVLAQYQAQSLIQARAIRAAKSSLPRTATPFHASAEARLDQLAREDSLDHDLAALKARLAGGAPPA